jgi:hypothetical protein
MANKIVAEYILVASGSITAPQLDILVYDTDDFNATERAKKMVAQLSKGGYFSFNLYVVKDEHKVVATFRVETPEPVVTVR